MILSYYLALETEPKTPGKRIPTHDSPYWVKLKYILENIDADLGSRVFRRVDTMDDDSDIVQKSSPLPSIAING